jgi:hypothetical protein
MTVSLFPVQVFGIVFRNASDVSGAGQQQFCSLCGLMFMFMLVH